MRYIIPQLLPSIANSATATVVDGVVQIPISVCEMANSVFGLLSLKEGTAKALMSSRILEFVANDLNEDTHTRLSSG